MQYAGVIACYAANSGEKLIVTKQVMVVGINTHMHPNSALPSTTAFPGDIL